MLCDYLEYFVYILASLRRCFHIVLDATSFAERHGLLRRNLSGFFHISVVSQEVNHDVVACVLSQLFQPNVLNVLEGHLVRNIEDEEHPVRASVEVARNRTEALLAGCVPDL